MKNADMPAAPTIYADMGHNGQREIFCDNQGLTKREHFAGLAMQAMLSNPNVIGFSQMCGWELVNCSREQLSKICIAHADELLSELEKSE